MRSAIYIDNRRTQIILTPENEADKAALTFVREQGKSITVKRGSAYYCNGGWVRIGDRGEDASVMLVIEDAPSASTPIFDTDSEGVLT